MFVSTFLNVLFIPVLYVVVQTLRGRFGGGARRHVEGPATEPDGRSCRNIPLQSVKDIGPGRVLPSRG